MFDRIFDRLFRGGVERLEQHVRQLEGHVQQLQDQVQAMQVALQEFRGGFLVAPVITMILLGLAVVWWRGNDS